MTGLFLFTFYISNIEYVFFSVENITRNINNDGLLIRYMHANGASLFFIVVYLHILNMNLYDFLKNFNVGRNLGFVKSVGDGVVKAIGLKNVVYNIMFQITRGNIPYLNKVLTYIFNIFLILILILIVIMIIHIPFNCGIEAEEIPD